MPEQDLFERKEWYLRQADCGIQYYLSDLFNLDRPVANVASQGWRLLFGAIDCFIVGFVSEGQQVLSRAEHFLSAAAANKELKHPVEMYYSKCLFNLVTCRWLSGYTGPRMDLTLAANEIMVYLTGIESKPHPIGLACLSYLADAELWEECISHYEKLTRRVWSVSSKWGEGSMAYQLALQQKIDNSSQPKVDEKIKQKFLRVFVKEWLSNGYFDDFARWVRLLEEPRSGEPAQQALRHVALQYCPRKRN